MLWLRLLVLAVVAAGVTQARWQPHTWQHGVNGRTEGSDSCWKCDNADSNEDCLRRGWQQKCGQGESCQTEIRKDNNRLRIMKQCKQTNACENQARQRGECGTGRPNGACWYCCAGGDCNRELPDTPLVDKVDREDSHEDNNRCVKSCDGKRDGDYQSCQGCNVYVSCAGGRMFEGRPCPANLKWEIGRASCRERV